MYTDTDNGHTVLPYASSAACAKHFGKTTGKQSKLQSFKNHFLDIRIGARQRVIAMWVKCFQNSCWIETVFILCPQSIFFTFKTNDALHPHTYLICTVTTTKWFIAIVCKQTAGQPDIPDLQTHLPGQQCALKLPVLVLIAVDGFINRLC